MRITTSDASPIVIHYDLSPPLVYLDNGVVGDIADKDIGSRIRDALIAAGGTLYWSWALSTELISICPGPTFDKISEYLASFGSQWALIDADPSVVIEREANRRPGQQNPALDDALVKQVFQNWDGKSPFDLSTLFAGLVENAALAESY